MSQTVWLSMRDLQAGQEGRLEVNGAKDLPSVTVECVAGEYEFAAVWGGGRSYTIIGIATKGLHKGDEVYLAGIFRASGRKKVDGKDTGLTLSRIDD